MHTIIVNKECGCFRRSDLENNIKLESKDDALLQALKTTTKMNEEFCQKHEFELKEENSNFIISIKEEPKAHSGCCGGGCHS